MPEPDESPVREVVDSAGGRWFVYAVFETSKWGAKQRAHWLCMESGEERRFLSPIPGDWMSWSDPTLLNWIYLAKPDLRG